MEEAKKTAQEEFDYISTTAKGEVRRAPAFLYQSQLSNCAAAKCCILSPNAAHTFPRSDFPAAGRPCGDDAEGSGSVVWESACYGQRRPAAVQPTPGILQGNDVVMSPLHLIRPNPHSPGPITHTLKIKEVLTQRSTENQSAAWLLLLSSLSNKQVQPKQKWLLLSFIVCGCVGECVCEGDAHCAHTFARVYAADLQALQLREGRAK